MELCSANTLQEQINNVSASGGGIVTASECIYVLTEPLLLKPGVHLKGAGKGKTIIRINPKSSSGSSASHKLLIADRSNNIKLSDITFDGMKDSRPDLINDPYAHSVEIAWVDSFEVNNIEIINSAGASIVLYNSKNGVIQNSIILNSGSNGILALQECKNIIINDNLIENTDHQNGIFFSYQLGKSCSNITIERNIVKNAADFGIEIGHTVNEGDSPHKNIIIRENKVYNSRNSGIAFRTVSFGVIENNLVEGYGQNGGYGGDGLFIEGFRNKAVDVRVMNNIIKQTNQTGDANAIYITGVDMVHVIQNQIIDSNGRGIFAQASVMGVTTKDFPNGRRRYNELLIQKNNITNSKSVGIQLQGEGSLNNEIILNNISSSGEEGILVANLDDLNFGLKILFNKIEASADEGIGLYKQSNFEINNNILLNNGKSTVEDTRKSGVRLTVVGNGSFVNNTFQDNQTIPTQIYYVVLRQVNGTVSNDDVLLIGGTRQKNIINSPNYSESNVIYKENDDTDSSSEFEKNLLKAVEGLENQNEATIDKILNIFKEIIELSTKEN